MTGRWRHEVTAPMSRLSARYSASMTPATLTAAPMPTATARPCPANRSAAAIPGTAARASAGSAASGATTAVTSTAVTSQAAVRPRRMVRAGRASSPPRNSGRLPQMYSNEVWPAALATAPAGADAPKLLAGIGRWARITPPSRAVITIWPTASTPVTSRVARRPAIITPASATGMAISSSGW